MQKWEHLFAKFRLEPRGSLLDRSKYNWLLYELNPPDAIKELKGHSRYDVFQELGAAGWELVQFMNESESEGCIAVSKRPIE